MITAASTSVVISIGVRSTIVVSLVLTALWSGCNRVTGPSAEAPPPPAPPVVVVPDPPKLTCPLPISATTIGTSAAVAYQTPPGEGGQSPLSVTCAPPSGNSFPIGSTDVRCTATDSLERTDSCVFAVTVTRIPTLSKTKFLAFGDSVTVGVVATFNPSGSPFYFLRDVPEDAYPNVLRQMLAARYGTQTFTMINEGKGGEKAVDGVRRASEVFNSNRPEVALILDGYNDLTSEAAIDPAIAAINDMAKDARFRGARVFLATLTGPPLGLNRGISNTTIARFNEKLKVIAKGENAVLVDLYEAFEADRERYNSDDARHPSVAGYRRIAETFFAAIRAELEVR